MNRVGNKFYNRHNYNIRSIRLAVLFGGFTTEYTTFNGDLYRIYISGQSLSVAKCLGEEEVTFHYNYPDYVPSVIKQIRNRKNKNQEENKYYFLLDTQVFRIE